MFDLPMFLTIIAAALIIMKIAGVITASWWIVLLPLILIVGIPVAMFVVIAIHVAKGGR
jgi:hypothetical protein